LSSPAWRAPVVDPSVLQACKVGFNRNGDTSFEKIGSAKAEHVFRRSAKLTGVDCFQLQLSVTGNNADNFRKVPIFDTSGTGDGRDIDEVTPPGVLLPRLSAVTIFSESTK
jgi:hypothetical protein